MSSPFPLDAHEDYLAWRTRKLAGLPNSIAALRVQVARLDAPSPAEIQAIRERLARCNMALVDCGDPGQIQAKGLLELGRRLGLRRTNEHLYTDEQAVSTIRVAPQGTAADYIPYTNRPLNWHTDGYYSPVAEPVRAWMLFCVQDAMLGGENALLDPEIAYLRLRDEDPALIRALMDPQALTIPPGSGAQGARREASVGPVFSFPEGRLHMRYTARTRHAIWRAEPTLTRAREALARLFSSNEGFIYRHKLRPGEGYVTNNVLHNRSGFEGASETDRARTLLRVRYLDRID